MRYLRVILNSIPGGGKRDFLCRTTEAEDEMLARIVPGADLMQDQFLVIDPANPCQEIPVSFQRLSDALDRAMVRSGEASDPEEDRLRTLGARRGFRCPTCSR